MTEHTASNATDTADPHAADANHAAAASHDAGHAAHDTGHGGGHAEDVAGPINWTEWAINAGAMALGLVVALVLVVAGQS